MLGTTDSWPGRCGPPRRWPLGGRVPDMAGITDGGRPRAELSHGEAPRRVTDKGGAMPVLPFEPARMTGQCHERLGDRLLPPPSSRALWSAKQHLAPPVRTAPPSRVSDGCLRHPVAFHAFGGAERAGNLHECRPGTHQKPRHDHGREAVEAARQDTYREDDRARSAACAEVAPRPALLLHEYDVVRPPNCDDLPHSASVHSNHDLRARHGGCATMWTARWSHLLDGRRDARGWSGWMQQDS